MIHLPAIFQIAAGNRYTRSIKLATAVSPYQILSPREGTYHSYQTVIRDRIKSRNVNKRERRAWGGRVAAAAPTRRGEHPHPPRSPFDKPQSVPSRGRGRVSRFPPFLATDVTLWRHSRGSLLWRYRVVCLWLVHWEQHCAVIGRVGTLLVGDTRPHWQVGLLATVVVSVVFLWIFVIIRKKTVSIS